MTNEPTGHVPPPLPEPATLPPPLPSAAVPPPLPRGRVARLANKIWRDWVWPKSEDLSDGFGY